MTPTATLLRDNAEYLARECQDRQHDSTITLDDALTYVDHDHVIAWTAEEIKGRSPQSMLADAFEGLTDAEAVSVLQCLLNETDTARKILAEQLRAYVADDLVQAAEVWAQNNEPRGPRTAPYASRRMDDDYGDWLHERRKQDKLDAKVSP